MSHMKHQINLAIKSMKIQLHCSDNGLIMLQQMFILVSHFRVSRCFGPDGAWISTAIVLTSGLKLFFKHDYKQCIFFADSVTENIPRQLSRQCQCVCVCVCRSVNQSSSCTIIFARWTCCVFAHSKYSEGKCNNFLWLNLPWDPQPGTTDCYFKVD